MKISSSHPLNSNQPIWTTANLCNLLLKYSPAVSLHEGCFMAWKKIHFRGFSPGEQFFPELFWECRQYNTLQCRRQKKVHMLRPAFRPASSICIHPEVADLSLLFQETTEQMLPRPTNLPCSAQQHPRIPAEAQRQDSCVVQSDTPENPSELTEPLLHLSTPPGCQGGSSKFTVRAPEPDPLFW